MKKFGLLMSFVFVGGLVMAQGSSKPADVPKAQAPAVKAHDVTAEFVSADSVKKTITIKTEDGQQKTIPVEGKADLTVYQITKVTKGRIKAGDKISVTCRDNEKGEHQAITAIVVALAAPAKTK
jgi:hypothetical protein